MEKAKKKTLNQRINVIRASVMGANDGILSIAGIVIGVAGASASNFAIFISGIAGMIAGTVSMTMGEYTSVSTEKDSQRHAILHEKYALKTNYKGECDAIRNKYLKTGMKRSLADQAVKEMMSKEPLVSAVRERYGFDINDFTSPYAAAIASMISFPTGSILPLASIGLAPMHLRIIDTFLAVIIALAITGYIAAIISNARRFHSLMRNVISGTLTMIVTYIIGRLL
ncbi:VIT1/CCC1 transporter family protein [Acetilactobacillus jinshanensis]|uniref:VIT family protein n=1 Tax=Acetilactobacillus jinshanensis TaxID=1720083 RepID=A0A4V1ALM4_9LACO|nr:VIT family protein [Acetilactobacillus jinshanensis]QBP18109.1 VIT family protein [Acetilactobacillus jinshanensis]URL60970.1 VIT family protein [uncultured bacterium]